VEEEALKNGEAIPFMSSPFSFNYILDVYISCGRRGFKA